MDQLWHNDVTEVGPTFIQTYVSVYFPAGHVSLTDADLLSERYSLARSR